MGSCECGYSWENWSHDLNSPCDPLMLITAHEGFSFIGKGPFEESLFGDSCIVIGGVDLTATRGTTIIRPDFRAL